MAMWRPPERIRHEPVSGPWPSAERAARSRLFSPIHLGPLSLEQRTWVPAMVPWRATDDGFVSPNVLAWYERFARGRPGAIVVEAPGIRDVPSGPLLRSGRGAEVRLCMYTNYCEALDQRHREVTCELWDREGLDQPDSRPLGRR